MRELAPKHTFYASGLNFAILLRSSLQYLLLLEHFWQMLCGECFIKYCYRPTECVDIRVQIPAHHLHDRWKLVCGAAQSFRSWLLKLLPQVRNILQRSPHRFHAIRERFPLSEYVHGLVHVFDRTHFRSAMKTGECNSTRLLTNSTHIVTLNAPCCKMHCASSIFRV